MAKVTMSMKVDAAIKTKAQKTARELGFPLSTLVNGYLHQLVRTKAVHFGASEGELLSDKKREYARIRKDIKAGKPMSPAFDSAESAIAHLRNAR